jgi:ABC-type proline/glycine betaine transport system permease subunit
MGEGINKAIGMVFLIVVIAALAPTIFGAQGLGNATLFSNAPVWLLPLLLISAGIGLVKLLIPSDH